MKKEIRTAVYDEDLRIEAYRFEGIMQPFPNHFHEHYVIGFVERGKRRLRCRNRACVIGEGDVLLFNPGDNHCCEQMDEEALDYRGFNVGKSVMLGLTREVTGRKMLPQFAPNVISDEEAAACVRALHEMVMSGAGKFEREEALLFLISALFRHCGQPFDDGLPECRQEIDRACEFMERHYAEHIGLEQICRCTALSKSTLLRAFTKSKGITPYRYLENVRINEAKKLLRQGALPLEAALKTGFSDQSHFTNYFSSFIGLPPGVYRNIFFGKENGEANET